MYKMQRIPRECRTSAIAQRIITALCLGLTTPAWAQLTTSSPVVPIDRKEDQGFCGGVHMVYLDDDASRPPADLPAPCGGQFSIAVSLDSSVTAAQALVIWQAVLEWQAIIDDAGYTPNNYHITFEFGFLPPPHLGLTTVFAYPCDLPGNGGHLSSAEMTFNTLTDWFVDPTPWDDSEFHTGDPNVPAGIDLLTVVRHEIGHALGFGDSCLATNLIFNGTFDPGRMNIGVVFSGGLHTDEAVHPNDLMNPSIATSTRRPITLYPDASLVARAFDYGMPGIHFVDDGAPGGSDENGSARFPWNTLFEGVTASTTAGELRVKPGVYHEHELVINRPMVILPMRGGPVIIQN